VVGEGLAAFLIAFIAIVPGFMNAFMFSSLVLDKRPIRKHLDVYPDLSILIPCFNEEAYVAQTIESVCKQDYLGKIEIIVIDDGSSDQTASIVANLEKQFQI